MAENPIGIVLSKAYSEKVPMCCTLEITKKCNFDCIHCYLKNNHNAELSIDEVKNVINEIKENGTIFLNITGGEVFTHKNFKEIYEYAYKSGMIITILTNGSIISNENREILKKCPPRKIEVTLYAYEDDVLNKVTKSNLHTKDILNNVLMLKGDGHNVLLKTIVLKENRKDFEKIKKFAVDNDFNFQYDFNILPTLKGDKEVINHQLDVDATIELELSDGKKEVWETLIKNYDLENNRKISCGCGKYSFNISCDLLVKRCNFIVDDREEYSLKKNSFKTIWEMWKQQESPLFKYELCCKCKYQSTCDICPSISYALAEAENGIVKRQCELARKRYELVNEENQNENSSY